MTSVSSTVYFVAEKDLTRCKNALEARGFSVIAPPSENGFAILIRSDSERNFRNPLPKEVEGIPYLTTEGDALPVQAFFAWLDDTLGTFRKPSKLVRKMRRRNLKKAYR